MKDSLDQLKSSFFSPCPKGWNEDFSDYPFREWAKIGEILSKGMMGSLNLDI